MAYPLCGDRRTLLWYANQRAVEYHPALVRAGHFEQPDVLVLDVDPPPGPATRAVAARAERLEPGLATTAFLREDRGGKVLIDAAAMHDGKRRARARRERGRVFRARRVSGAGPGGSVAAPAALTVPAA